MKNKNVLITGGAGFIGSTICSKLVEQGYQPVVIDSFIQYISPFKSKYQKYLEYRFKGFKEKVIIERGDIRYKNDVQRVISKYQPSIIIHLAALPIADLCFTHPEEAITSILNGTVNILDIIKDLDFIERFVYTSSSMVYGDFVEIPIREEAPKCPKDNYGGTKLAGEILTESYSRHFGIKYSIVRPSAVYGPTDVNQRVGQIFIENALKNEKIVLHGGGENMLDFTYIEDIADGFILASFKPEGENQTFNITRGEGRSLKELATILQQFFPNLDTEVKPMQVYRPKRGALSIEKAKKLLGYSPKYSLEEGIAEYVEFYKNKINTQ